MSEIEHALQNLLNELEKANLPQTLKAKLDVPVLAANAALVQKGTNKPSQTEKVFRAIYCSHSSVNVSALKTICEKASEKNKSLNLSGMLVHREKNIIQIIEGEKSSVESTLEKIKFDQRHKSFNLLSTTNDCSRLFSNWSMGLHEVNKDDYSRLMTILRGMKEIQYAVENVDFCVKPFVMPQRIVRNVWH